MKKKIGKALVVGAGIAGIRSALDLAEIGYGVVLIDKAEHIGGVLSQLDYQFPTNHCGMCRMLPLVERDAGSQFCLRKGLFHENIEILLGTRVTAVAGEPGRFTVSLRTRPTWVDPQRCTGCGACVPVCPVEVPDAFNAGLGRRKAIYLPVPHQVPNAYRIDPAACTRCGACVDACPCGAIALSTAERKDFRILVVDDEPIVRQSLESWLEDEGFAVDTAASAPEALEALEKSEYQLMLSDIKMAGMDGVELLRQAKTACPDLAVVLMTAYATVETAVEAMKIGALDYLVKPFDPETLVPMVMRVHEELLAAKDRQVEVGAIVLAGGTDYFDPRQQAGNPYGYGRLPAVVTSLEFERIVSGSGPTTGRLVRPHDGRPIRKIAWLQCVGSRDIQCGADFCSSICCMYAVKEAMLAREKGAGEVEAAIFYMDMRCFGKPFQRYRDRAEAEGVRFERGRIHSLAPAPGTADPTLRFVALDGTVREETFDLVVLAVGQRPARGAAELAQMVDLPLNPWGFLATSPLSAVRTERPGIVAGGSFAGLRDIGESVIFASAAANEASRVLHGTGGSLAAIEEAATEFRDVSRQPPEVLVAVCTCGDRILSQNDRRQWIDRLERDPVVQETIFIDRVCTAEGWQALADAITARRPNRVLIGACHPYVFTRRLRELGRATRLHPALMDVVDLLGPRMAASGENAEAVSSSGDLPRRLAMAVARLQGTCLPQVEATPVSRQALVVGGGIAGMTAALAIADCGYPVDLVEAGDRLGGNLRWIGHTLDGHDLNALLAEAIARVGKHPKITVHANTRVRGAFGEVGHFYSTLEAADGAAQTLEHGVVVLATGGGEAAASAYGFGSHPAIVTQKGFQEALAEGRFDPAALNTVVMIQCVGSREEPRNFCSRVCCPTTLKQALALKRDNPEATVVVLYRDLMTYGFAETWFTRARRAGVIFVAYRLDDKPKVEVAGPDRPVTVTVTDAVLGRPLTVAADAVVLATGIAPGLPADLAAAYGATLDQDGFLAEAESKWRPVDSLREGVFACGLALGPRNVEESVATAGAAAQRALRILERERLPAAHLTAVVRHSLCARCGRCIEACPYEARRLDEELDRVLVNPAMCQGCGACEAVCPNGAAVLNGLSMPQVFGMLDQALA
ncbi:MAG TPA: response regulator [Desulfobacteraceae bacterium]|nr:FAD-dependent oxidoreductase [Deltaproteobacteria bacterium]HDI59945.1 response regulator [Desulfobacteraceae bacterium]